MSYYSLCIEGLMPWGSLIAGTLAASLGPTRGVMITGGLCVIGGLWFWIRLERVRVAMRPIYERLGILPNLDLAEDVEA